MNSSWGKNLGYFAIFSPLAMIIGYAILMARSGQGPDTGWFLSHVFLLIGVGLMIPTSIGIKVILNQVARRVSDIGMTLSFFGGLALIGQFAIDLAVGQLSANQSEMIELFNLLANSPIIALAFQSVGPIVFYIGLLILNTLLWNKRVIAWQPGVICLSGGNWCRYRCNKWNCINHIAWFRRNFYRFHLNCTQILYGSRIRLLVFKWGN